MVPLEQPAEIELVFKAHGDRHFLDVAVSVLQKLFRSRHAELVDVRVDADAGFFLEDPAQIAGA